MSEETTWHEPVAPDGLQRIRIGAPFVPMDIEAPALIDVTVFQPRGTIYIAGPMRGYKEFNFPAFYAAETKLRNQGWVVGNPARMDDDDKIEYTVMPGNQGVRLAMERDLVWIAKYADAMYMLKGWEKSEGADAEWTLAKTLGLQIYYEATL